MWIQTAEWQQCAVSGNVGRKHSSQFAHAYVDTSIALSSLPSFLATPNSLAACNPTPHHQSNQREWRSSQSQSPPLVITFIITKANWRKRQLMSIFYSSTSWILFQVVGSGAMAIYESVYKQYSTVTAYPETQLSTETHTLLRLSLTLAVRYT